MISFKLKRAIGIVSMTHLTVQCGRSAEKAVRAWKTASQKTYHAKSQLIASRV